MELEDIPQVLEVDRESYSLPWPASAYRREILHNRNARYLVMRAQAEDEIPEDVPRQERPRSPLPFIRWARGGIETAKPGRVIGYAGMWIMVDEAHITTIAMRGEWRGLGLGELLLTSLIEQAVALGADRVTLEVRVSNEPAQSLYRKYGFQQAGRRLRYYSDNNEDAFIMTTESVRSPDYSERFARLVDALERRLAAQGDLEVVAPSLGTSPGGEAENRVE